VLDHRHGSSSPSTPRSISAPPPCSTPPAQAVLAQETLDMKRGHAEALMPLIAR